MSRKQLYSKQEIRTAVQEHGSEAWAEFVRIRDLIKEEFAGKPEWVHNRPQLMTLVYRMAYDRIMAMLKGEMDLDEDTTTPMLPPGEDPDKVRAWRERKRQMHQNAEFVRRLAEAARNAGRTADLISLQRWAFQNISTEWSAISEDTVPDPGAPAYLAWLKTPKGKEVFFSEMTKRGGRSAKVARERPDPADVQEDTDDMALTACRLFRETPDDGEGDHAVVAG